MNITTKDFDNQENKRHTSIRLLLLVWMDAITGLSLNDAFVTAPGEAPLPIPI